MASNLRIRRSVLDRLLAEDAPIGLVMTQSVAQLRDAVARDIETLLNTRAPMDFERMPGMPHARDSVLTFGVRDFVGRVLSNSEEQRYVGRSLATAIETHEPRLTQVQVRFHDEQAGQSTNSLSFTIRALLVVHPTKEAVSFDAVLQPSVSRFSVMQARFGAGTAA
ncbi:type VI secretion system baseplate subunit TssE [Pseudorhodoferax sp.]|uniref:type VI secretion system baseplate subunit TssE n=1 Tax=Pseudorhodoferax sp. TaxID=1993553 RepID=UPI0039E6BB07